ncbi:MAG: hypothetical protein IT371_12110 [Deltaproteobacteria bacterium]|nr:hypothetical protein [Deltaproteobacteria bacterium]
MLDTRLAGSILAASAALVTIVAPSPTRASDPDVAGMQRIFTAMEGALRTPNEKVFKAHWFPAGYEKNLVGGSGLPGKAVFGQGSRKKWYLKADFSKLTSVGRGGPWIVYCDIWSWEREKAVDDVHAALIYVKKQWVVLGAGEKKEQVEALAKRYLAKQPLEPPASK